MRASQCPSCGSYDIGRPGLTDWRAWLRGLVGRLPIRCKACGMSFDPPPGDSKLSAYAAWAEKFMSSPWLIPVGAAVALLAGVGIYWALTPSRQIPVPPSSRQAIMATATIVTTSTTTTTLPQAPAEDAKPARQTTSQTTRKPPPRAVTPPPSRPAPAVKRIYTVQFGAFRTPEGAQTMVRRLANRGIKTRVDQVHTGGKLWFKVRTGNYRSRAQAVQAAQQLKKKSGTSTVVASVRPGVD